jgi:hypothetical protein
MGGGCRQPAHTADVKQEYTVIGGQPFMHIDQSITMMCAMREIRGRRR